jgi:hypothetical protein
MEGMKMIDKELLKAIAVAIETIVKKIILKYLSFPDKVLIG